MMVQYIVPIYRLFASDHRIRCFVTGSKIYQANVKKCAEDLGLAFLPSNRARLCWWDLIVFADHWWQTPFPSKVPKLFTQHGIPNNKIIKGVEYAYGRAVLHNKSRYNTIFAPSLLNRDRAVELQPCLRDHIAVVGDLRVDAVLELAKQHRQIRKRLGFSENDKVVLFMSTWGPMSLMERFGPALFEEARHLMDRGIYKFIIGSHPNLWQQQWAVERPWGDFLRAQRAHGFLVMEPDESWEPYVAACDLAVSDHTSLSLYYTMLGKPIVFVPSVTKDLAEGSVQIKLINISSSLESPQQLEKTLQRTFQEYPIDKLQQLSHDICSYPGEAAQRITVEIYDLLRLAPPEASK